MPEVKKLKCPGIQVRTKQWNALQDMRKATKQRLRDYLAEDACVAGVPNDVTGLNPLADELGNAFVAVVKHEMVGHTDATESLRSMRTIALLLGEIVNVCVDGDDRSFHREDKYERILGPKRKQAVTPEVLRAFSATAATLTIADETDRSTLELAELLAKAFPKSCAEYAAALRGGDAASVIHHTAIVGDLFSEMLDLVQYMRLREERDFPEYAVPALRKRLGVE